jgi:hypothetical protein
MHHLEDEIQNKYALDDSEMDMLVDFLKGFGSDYSATLRRLRRNENKGHLEKVMRDVLNKDMRDESYKDFKLDPVTMQDTLTYPMGMPLTQQNIQLEPHHYDGGFTF